MDLFTECESELDIRIESAYMTTKGAIPTYSQKIYGEIGTKPNEPPGSHIYYYASGKTKLAPNENPKAICVTIRFRNDQIAQMAPSFVNAITNMQDTDVTIKYNPPPVDRTKKGVKEQYSEIVEEIKQKNYLLKIQFEKVCSQLDELGCSYRINSGPTYRKIDDNYYEWDEHICYTCSSIIVHCHDKTNFYEQLKSSGFLHKYYIWPNVCSKCNSIQYCLS
jgi:hypothetical protein